MNHAKTIHTIADRTDVSWELCEQIVASYEKYGAKNMTRMSSKHLPAITAFIAADTDIAVEICEQVIQELFRTLKAAIRSKIPFRK